MKIIILAPRLDVPFKDLGPIPEQRGPIPPIREHWRNFVFLKFNLLRAQGHDVQIIEKPLFQFTEEFVASLDYDQIYIPHREAHSLPAKNALYYMQTVFPWRFYVDPKGFAGGSTLYPFPKTLLERADSTGLDRFEYRNRMLEGLSKFDQPKSGKWNMHGYVLFTCQIPHDQTILYHSDVSVEAALRATCEATKKNGMTLVVKGHPVNPGAMETLRKIALEYSHVVWIDNVSILDAVVNAQSVVTVNSGTGMEALALGKPVLTFGRCEYDCVTTKTNLTTIDKDVTISLYNETEVNKFFSAWNSVTFDTRIVT